MADTLVPGSTPPDTYVSNLGGNYKSAAERTEANQDALFLKAYSGMVMAPLQNNLGVADTFDVRTLSGRVEDQFIAVNRIDGDYVAPGSQRTSNDDYRKTEITITPDRAVESTEYIEGYDAALSQIDDIARIATEQGRMLERAREQKACRALAKASLTNSYWNSTDNEAVFLGSDGTTDYGLASNRTQTLTGITTEAGLLSSDGDAMRSAISKVAEIMYDIGLNPAFNEARCVLIPKHWNWFHHSTAGIQTYDRDVNGVNLRSYANMMDTEFSIDGIRLTMAPFMSRAILQSVTYGWSATGLNGFERDAATKYVSDNSKLVAVVYLPSAVYGAQVLGPQVDSYFDRTRRAQALWAGSDIAFKGIRNEYAFPIILDS